MVKCIVFVWLFLSMVRLVGVMLICLVSFLMLIFCCVIIILMLIIIGIRLFCY